MKSYYSYLILAYYLDAINVFNYQQLKKITRQNISFISLTPQYNVHNESPKFISQTSQYSIHNKSPKLLMAYQD
jgi:hypothetical protein